MSVNRASIIHRLRAIRKRLEQDRDQAAERFIADKPVKSDERYRETIKYIAACFSSFSVAYISVGVFQQIFTSPQQNVSLADLIFNPSSPILYSLVAGMLLALSGVNTLRFLDEAAE